MNDFDDTRRELGVHLDRAVAANPLDALHDIGEVKADVERHQRAAVRAAAQQHTWTEIGVAMGVSKQAAHQKFAKDWANDLKGELKSDNRELKAALRKGDPAEAAAAKAKLESVIEEFKGVRRQGRRG